MLCCFLGACFVFEDAAVAEDDALAVFVEFDDLELEGLTGLGLCSVFFDEVLGRCKAFYAVLEGYDSAFVKYFGDCAFVD